MRERKQAEYSKEREGGGMEEGGKFEGKGGRESGRQERVGEKRE